MNNEKRRKNKKLFVDSSFFFLHLPQDCTQNSSRSVHLGLKQNVFIYGNLHLYNSFSYFPLMESVGNNSSVLRSVFCVLLNV